MAVLTLRNVQTNRDSIISDAYIPFNLNPTALQMEEEALKLKQMQSEVDSSFTSPGAGLNTSRDDPR